MASKYNLQHTDKVGAQSFLWEVFHTCAKTVRTRPILVGGDEPKYDRKAKLDHELK